MKYTKEHEWIKIEGNVATIGITQHAADALGELVYVELPQIGDNFGNGDTAVVVESSKSASDVYSPIEGEVVEVNKSLESKPENVNASPYKDGWLIKLKVDGKVNLDEFMSESEYNQFLKEQA